MSKDIVSILSVNNNPQSTRSSVHHKLLNALPSTSNEAGDNYGAAVTVTVDGFGTLVGDRVIDMQSTSVPSTPGGDSVEEPNSPSSRRDFSDEPDSAGEEEYDIETLTESQAPSRAEPQIVYRYTFRNRNRMHVQVITYGATVTAMCVPDRFGRVEDVLLGYDTLQAYVDERAPTNGAPPLMGATIGRCCNRIAGGQYRLDEQGDNPEQPGSMVSLTRNDRAGRHHADGGFHGLDRCVWTPHLDGTVLTLTALSVSGTDGYPGTVMARATFELLPENTFRVSYAATTTLPTPLNMCCNLLLNLAGHAAGHAELYKHVVTLNGDRTALADEGSDGVPISGELCCVGGTVMDLRVPHELGPAIARCPNGGYDEYWCLVKGSEQKHTFAGRVVHPKSGRVLEVYTDQPGVRFYTGNRMPDPGDDINPTEVYTQDFFEIPSTTTGRLGNARGYNFDDDEEDGRSSATNSVDMLALLDEECPEDDEEEMSSFGLDSNLDFNQRNDEPIVGKLGALYMRHGAFTLSPQAYPNAVNVSKFPNVVLYPGKVYEHEVVYKFGVYRRQRRSESMHHCVGGY